MHTHPEVSEAGHDTYLTELHGVGAVKNKVLRFAVRTASFSEEWSELQENLPLQSQGNMDDFR